MTIKVQANSQNQWFWLRIIIEQRTSRYRAFKLSNSGLHENLIQLIEIMLGVFNGTGIWKSENFTAWLMRNETSSMDVIISHELPDI